jgi:prephenate dehydratase
MMRKIAILGPVGTFSELAFLKYTQTDRAEAVYYHSIEATFDALDECDMAIVPLENTLDGFVQSTLDLLFERDLSIIDEVVVPVQFAFLGNVERIEDVKRLYVQFVAQGQCAKFLRSLPASTIIQGTDSNMESHRLVKHGRKGDGAIVPAHQCDSYDGLVLLPVTDAVHNATRFVVLAKAPRQATTNIVRISMVVSPVNDRPGLLYDILGIFKFHEVNLSAIMSRPTKTAMGRYHFYLEMKSDRASLNTIHSVIDRIQGDYQKKILGIYSVREE